MDDGPAFGESPKAKVGKRISRPTVAGMNPPDDREFVQRAFYLLLGIRASESESRASLKTIAEWRALPGTESDSKVDRARDYFIWALVNHNDFITLR